MAKKNFKNGLNNLFKENADEINQINSNKEKEKITTDIDLEDISDEKLKWFLIKIQRYEKELKLWRTGNLTLNSFLKSLEDDGLKYDEESNKIVKK